MNIVIFGAGYVGTVTGACLASLGHKITFVDPNLIKIEAINAGKAPIVEPKLDDLIWEGHRKGMLCAKPMLQNDLLKADMAMITVATPSLLNGILQVTSLQHVLEAITKGIENRTRPLIVVIRSTIHFLALRQELKISHLDDHPMISIVVNPEFLRESTAVDDFFHAPFSVAGGDNREKVHEVLDLYKELNTQKFAVSLEIASLLKYACNAFHAMKIAFTNEISSLCDAADFNPLELMDIFCHDHILNCSAAYLKPGFAFGGSCLPKDLRSLLSLGRDLGETLPLLSTILPSNQLRFQKTVEKVLQGNHTLLAFLGITFKKNSDDLRESPFVDLAETLVGKGIRLKIYDPDVQINRLVGSNLAAFHHRTTHLVSFLQNSLAETLTDCDGIVICKNFIDDHVRTFIEEHKVAVYDLGYFLMQEKVKKEDLCFA